MDPNDIYDVINMAVSKDTDWNVVRATKASNLKLALGEQYSKTQLGDACFAPATCADQAREVVRLHEASALAGGVFERDAALARIGIESSCKKGLWCTM